MKLPKKASKLLRFNKGPLWYQITQEGENKFVLYRCESDEEYTSLATGNNPPKLENKVRDGKIK